MPALTRRGFSLVEVLVAMTLAAIVMASAYKVLVRNQRVYGNVAEKMDLQQGLRAAAVIVPAALRELDATDGDITAMTDSSISVRAFRQFAIVCNPPTLGGPLTNRNFIIRQAPFFGTRNFAVGDSLFLFYEGLGVTNRMDDGWVSGKVTAVSNNNCPGGGAGTQLTVDLNLNGLSNTAGTIISGAPVRGFEPVSFRRYTSGGKAYLAIQTTQGTQPFIETLSGSSGVSFAYYDSTGAVTASVTRVAQVNLVLRGTASRATYQATGAIGTAVDTLAIQVALRNNRLY